MLADVRRLGFSVSDRQVTDDALSAIDNHEFTTEPRLAVDAVIGGQLITAFNDIAFVRFPGQKTAAIAVEAAGRPFVSYAADAIVVATPTGSTAYAFSSGGPVAWPEVQALLVVPNAAHALFARPLVISPESTVAITVADAGHDGVLGCDGRRTSPVPAGARVTVRRGGKPVFIARTHALPFTDRLVAKFGLPVSGFRAGRERLD